MGGLGYTWAVSSGGQNTASSTGGTVAKSGGASAGTGAASGDGAAASTAGSTCSYFSTAITVIPPACRLFGAATGNRNKTLSLSFRELQERVSPWPPGPQVLPTRKNLFVGCLTGSAAPTTSMRVVSMPQDILAGPSFWAPSTNKCKTFSRPSTSGVVRTAGSQSTIRHLTQNESLTRSFGSQRTVIFLSQPPPNPRPINSLARELEELARSGCYSC